MMCKDSNDVRARRQHVKEVKIKFQEQTFILIYADRNNAFQFMILDIFFSCLIIIVSNLIVTMQKIKPNHPDSHIFTFTNSVKNSQHDTPDTSNNVSFLNGINASIKTFYTQPYSLLKDSTFPHLFNTHNKENERNKRMNTSNTKDDKWKYMTNPRFQNTSSNKKSFNRTNSKQILKQRNTSPLNIKIDLSSSINTDDAKFLKNSSTTHKKPKSIPKDQNIKVFIRLKPKNQKELAQKNVIQVLNEKTIKIEENYFCFDQIFGESINQQKIFNQVGLQMCNRLFQGYNGTIFAYGQTGSGKTYTIFGQQSKQHYGLIYRCFQQILAHKQRENLNVKIKCSMVELYKQQLIDMFGTGVDLKLKQNKTGEVFIQGLKELPVRCEGEMMNLVKNAAKGRKVAATKMNEESSRSHTLLNIYLEFEKYTTKLCLIDLAGSQKVCKSGAKGDAFQQTKKINSSLSCLGNVINALTTRSKSDHIPFRDSKLTRLLKDSLTGNFLTSIIVNCSLSEQSVNQTISSLKFAERAKKIKVNVQSLEEKISENQSISHLHSIIKRLQHDLQVTNNELKKYKQTQKSLRKQNSELQRQNSFTKNKMGPLKQRNNSKIQDKKEQQSDVPEFELTARYPIPSERAFVEENIKRYRNQIGPAKPHSSHFFAVNESSLNVSKSVRKLGDNSPDLSSLQFKCDESPDLSLSFSIQGQSSHKQLFFNSPL